MHVFCSWQEISVYLDINSQGLRTHTGNNFSLILIKVLFYSTRFG